MRGRITNERELRTWRDHLEIGTHKNDVDPVSSSESTPAEGQPYSAPRFAGIETVPVAFSASSFAAKR